MSLRFPECVLCGAVLLLLLAIGGCERESRPFDDRPPAANVRDVEFAATMVGRDERSAYALAAGKRLWTWYNCNGCHANGGGGSGPALIDAVWIYGGDARAVYQSIAQGRANGMPAFGSRVPPEQLWQLAAYVRSMAGLAPLDAAPNRDDAFLTRTPESFRDAQKPETERPASGPQRSP